MEYRPPETNFGEEFMKDLKDYKQFIIIMYIILVFSVIFCCLGFRVLWKKRIRRMKCIRKFFISNKTAHFHQHTHDENDAAHGVTHLTGHINDCDPTVVHTDQ